MGTARAFWKEVSVAHTGSTDAAGTAGTAGTAAPHSAAGEVESPLHEGSNIQLRALIRFVVIFVAAAVVIHLLIYWIFAGFRAAVGQERQITGVTAEHIPPPEPRLQPSVQHNQLPSLDLARLHENERAEFARRGWVDEKTGEVRVPETIATRIAEMSRPQK
jgi:hypothetical protein